MYVNKRVEVRYQDYFLIVPAISCVEITQTSVTPVFMAGEFSKWRYLSSTITKMKNQIILGKVKLFMCMQ